MLLYKDDIYEQGAYIHTTTTNSSFKHMHFVLKKMGIQNNLFFLGLYHKELKNINVKKLNDPSVELASLIAAECAMNPWYYFREIITIPGQGDPVPFILNRANLMLAWCFYNNIDIFILRGIHKKGIIRFGTYTISLMIPYDFFIKLCICLMKP